MYMRYNTMHVANNHMQIYLVMVYAVTALKRADTIPPNVLGLNPNATKTYSEEELSIFYPPEMFVTAGEIPSPYFSPPINLQAVNVDKIDPIYK